ncbi:GGDEF domain-containing protein, partial [Corallococcus exiguus]|uniref:diguanylate cyclase domain-containing protein n=1 Tax=Corallococcus exiguus TaxID=83462 RepID=UPI001475FA9E
MDTFSHLKGPAHSPFGWDRKQAAQDLFVLVSALLIVAWIAYEIRIFGSLVADLPPGKEIDLYEAVFLGGVLCICLWIFSWRRLKELRQEANRRVLAEERAADAELRALRDPLTGLGNRAQFDARLEDLVGGMNNRKGETRTAALFLLDLNHFKQVND